jgi:hypothetical protein
MFVIKTLKCNYFLNDIDIEINKMLKIQSTYERFDTNHVVIQTKDCILTLSILIFYYVTL